MKRSFAKLANHMDLIFRKKLWFVMLEQFLMKYIWGLAGLVMVAWPIISGKVFDWTVFLSIIPVTLLSMLLCTCSFLANINYPLVVHAPVN